LIARLFRTVVPGAILFACVSAAGFAQTSSAQPGFSPTQSQTSPAPTTKKYVLPTTLSAHAYPAATATPNPNGIQFSGKARAYDFDRVNHVANAANPNRHVFGASIEPHFDYRVGSSNFNVGYSYFASSGFGLNGGPNNAKVLGPQGGLDNTLPAYPLNSPIHEAYVQYKDNTYTVTVGDQELNYFWAPASDSRLQPEAYQGLDASIKLSRNLTFGLTDIDRFQARNSSNYEDNTLLTAPYSGASSVIAKSGTETPGTLRTGLVYKPVSNVSLTAENYQFYDIANLSYGEAIIGLAPKSAANPYLAGQFVAENSVGQDQVKRIYNHTFGAQLGANVAKGLLFTVSADIAPWQYAYVKAKSLSAAEAGYFLPSGGTGVGESIGHGEYKVAYGGIASPYTDSYASDPIYTTMITQGAVDRRSAGNSGKVALVYTTPNKRFKFIAAEGYFQYTNQISRNITSEYNLDGTYYLSKVKSGPYHGLFVRVRYAPRTIPAIPYNFQYQRFQTEYDF
jgi:hypothetical protein